MFDRFDHLNSVDRLGVQNTKAPRDAASLLIVDRCNGSYKVLMGQRPKHDGFMPDVFVFPGGGVEPIDRETAAGCSAHFVPTLAEFNSNHDNGFPPAFDLSLLICALRETFEETGLDLSELTKSPNQKRSSPLSSSLQCFEGDEWQVLLERFVFLSRAITPPMRTKRFDTRFFVIEINSYQNLDIVDTSELRGLLWVTFEEALALNLHAMTRVILEDLNDYMNQFNQGDQPLSIAFYHMIDDNFLCERLVSSSNS